MGVGQPVSAQERAQAEHWIEKFLQIVSNPYGMCAEATTAMQLACPFLRRVGGMVEDGMWGPRAHWWLAAPDGEVFDPTASQFPAVFEYIEGTAPTGKCMDCGEILFNKKTFCNDDCEAATAAYLNEEMQKAQSR